MLIIEISRFASVYCNKCERYIVVDLNNSGGLRYSEMPTHKIHFDDPRFCEGGGIKITDEDIAR